MIGSRARRRSVRSQRRRRDATAAPSKATSTAAVTASITRQQSPSYEETEIDESRGERWFCTETEARSAGWRAPRG